MQACVRHDDRVCSGWFAVEQGLRQGCVLAPPLFNILFFAAVINVVYTCFSRQTKTSWSLFGASEEENGGGGRGEATAGEPVLATSLWGTLYADDAGVVSQSSEQLKRVMGVKYRGRIRGVWPHRIGGQD